MLESIDCTEEEAFGKLIIILSPQFKPGIVPMLGNRSEKDQVDFHRYHLLQKSHLFLLADCLDFVDVMLGN